MARNLPGLSGPLMVKGTTGVGSEGLALWVLFSRTGSCPGGQAGMCRTGVPAVEAGKTLEAWLNRAV